MLARTRLASRNASALAIPRILIASVMAVCQLPSAAWHASASTAEVCAVSSATVATGQPSAQPLASSSAAASSTQLATAVGRVTAVQGSAQELLVAVAGEGDRLGRELFLPAWEVVELRSPRGRAVRNDLAPAGRGVSLPSHQAGRCPDHALACVGNPGHVPSLRLDKTIVLLRSSS